jgi:hypothetical protein
VQIRSKSGLGRGRARRVTLALFGTMLLSAALRRRSLPKCVKATRSWSEHTRSSTTISTRLDPRDHPGHGERRRLHGWQHHHGEWQRVG